MAGYDDTEHICDICSMHGLLHPELFGLDPEDYPEIARMRMLADVAPYSREYQRAAARVRGQAHHDPDLLAEYERIADQVRQTKESTLQVAQRHFNAPVDEIEGTVRSASAAGSAENESAEAQASG